MKPLLTLVLFCLSCSTLFGQIPNAGFESWSNGDPVGWVSNNALPVVEVVRPWGPHSGAHSAKGQVIKIQGTEILVTPILLAGSTGEGFPISQRYAGLSGYYEFYSVGGDRFSVNVAFRSGEVLVAHGAAYLPEVLDWTQFTVPMLYFTNDIPTKCEIEFIVSGPGAGNDYHENSGFLVDDLSFSGTTDVADATGKPGSFVLEQNFPNPFNPTTEIRYHISTAGRVMLKVYDLTGKEVRTLVDEVLGAGTHTARFNAEGLASGVYYYRLHAGKFSQTKKLVLMR